MWDAAPLGKRKYGGPGAGGRRGAFLQRFGDEDSEISPEDKIILKTKSPESGTLKEGTVEEFIEGAKETIIQQAKQYIKDNFLSVYGTLADLDKDALIMREVPVDDLALQTGGVTYEVKKITFIVRARTVHSKAKVERHLLSDKAMVTSAVLPSGENTEVEFKAVQVANKSEGKLFRRVRKVKSNAT